MKKVLIVEDDKATRQLFALYLEGEGYDIFQAADGKEGVEKARAHRPDLVLLDLMLPELHGVGVCQKIKADPNTRHAKVLIVSVKGFPADQKQTLQAGADGFMTKPVERLDFIAAVRNFLK